MATPNARGSDTKARDSETVAIFASAHRAVDLALLVEHADLVVDPRNAVHRRLVGRTSGHVPPNVDVR